MNKKHHLEEKVKELNSRKIMLKVCITSYLKAWVKPQNHFILMISASEMGDCTTRQEQALNDQKREAKIG